MWYYVSTRFTRNSRFPSNPSLKNQENMLRWKIIYFAFNNGVMNWRCPSGTQWKVYETARPADRNYINCNNALRFYLPNFSVICLRRANVLKYRCCGIITLNDRPDNEINYLRYVFIRYSFHETLPKWRIFFRITELRSVLEKKKQTNNLCITCDVQ